MVASLHRLGRMPRRVPLALAKTKHQNGDDGVLSDPQDPSGDVAGHCLPSQAPNRGRPPRASSLRLRCATEQAPARARRRACLDLARRCAYGYPWFYTRCPANGAVRSEVVEGGAGRLWRPLFTLLESDTALAVYQTGACRNYWVSTLLYSGG